jgi:hypothetical protein
VPERKHATDKDMKMFSPEEKGIKYINTLGYI